MLRITVTRLRIFFAVMGCAILGASLVDWAQSLQAAESGYAWVHADALNAPAIETAEIWRSSASCMRPFFIDAVLRSKARLKAYYDLVPAEVRAARTPARRIAMHDDTYRLVNDRQGTSGSNATQSERGAMLHARYAEWYANVFKLEIDEHQWEQRLSNVADRSVTVGDATRRSVSAGGSAAGDFDRNLVALLGLGGFPADVEETLRARCITIDPVKKVFQSTRYLGELYRWPLDYAATFSFGLELLLLAIFFVPVDLWVGTGDRRAAQRHVAEVAVRFAVSAHRQGSRLAARALSMLFGVLAAVAAATRAIFTARINSGAPVAQIHFVAKLAEFELPRQLVPIADGRALGKTVAWLKRAGANRSGGHFA